MLREPPAPAGGGSTNPPETRKTYERLIQEGQPEEDAKKLIGCVIAAEMFYVMKQEKPFDHARFVEALDRLPEITG